MPGDSRKPSGIIKETQNDRGKHCIWPVYVNTSMDLKLYSVHKRHNTLNVAQNRIRKLNYQIH